MEKAHDISLDEPCVAHQAILFMLDVLMRNSKQTLTLEELYDSFGDKSFTPQMLRAVGGNEQGLKQFLSRYPSLFTVNGDLISANSGGSQMPRLSGTPERYLRKKTKTGSDPNDSSSSGDINSSSSSSSSSTPNGQAEVQENSKTMKEIEQEAIAFFRKQMNKREEDWLPIVSVAGHASQSSSDIRKFVGPQNEFKQFLLKYPHIFVVREDYCGLKGRADVSSAPFPPPSPPPKRRLPTSVALNNGVLTRTHSFKQANRYSACVLPTTPTSLTSSLINSSSTILGTGMAPPIINPSQTMNPTSQKPRLTPVEVKAVHYVMRILHKNGRMLLQTIPGLISRAPEQVSNIVGFTREDLIQFFKRHSAIFQLHPDGCVSVKQDAVKALILKDSTNTNANVTVTNGNSPFIGQDNPGIISNSGVILRIFPKYGILNMDNNEQVFFDIQSCQFETFSDLTTILHTGDRLCFNAMIGPRDGSTKWRSIKTWIKMKPQQSNSSTNMMGILDNMSSHSDADKSDDSSTSSSHGGYPRNLINTQLPFNTFTPGQMFQPTGFYLPSQQNNVQTPPPTSNSPVQNVSTPIEETNINGILSSGPNSNGSSLLNSVNIGSGDFNQYQLDGEFQPSGQNGANSEENSVLNESLNSSLIQSASASNLMQLNKTDPISTSKSINSFSNVQENAENKTTKFMKQSPDNISHKESAKPNSSGAEMVSIGCQTISTGDVAVTNVYIE